VTRPEDFERELAAWRDGELPWHRRLRVERRLRRDPEARRRLAALDTAAQLLREADAAGPQPDLWEALRLRLPALDARRAEAAAEARRRRPPPRCSCGSATPASARRRTARCAGSTPGGTR
jgi:anti-sigma factor RsiW